MITLKNVRAIYEPPSSKYFDIDKQHLKLKKVRDKIIKMIDDGMMVSEIARQLGQTNSYVNYHYKKGVGK